MKRLIVWFLALALIPCILVFVTPFLNPDNYLIISLLTLLVPVSLIFLIIALVSCLAIKLWRLAVAYGVLIIVNFGNWTSLIGYSNKKLDVNQSFSVVSYNASFFSIPSVYSKTYFDSASAAKGDSIVRWIEQQKPMIVCLQEFFTDGDSRHHNYRAKLKAIGYNEYLLAIPNPKNKTLRGLITLSKFPIVGAGEIFLSKSRYNGAGYVDLKINEDTVRVVNVHLESMELYFANKKWRDQVRHFWQNYSTAMVQRTQQTHVLMKFVQESKYPIIVAGDFNETPFSYNHSKVRAILTNAFESSGSGFGFTYRKGRLPLRIDHQYFSGRLEVGNFSVEDDVTWSDHLPIYARYQLIHN
jgi:endonuclease/exonuclease/phosphatase family metal-dependent hydrolase